MSTRKADLAKIHIAKKQLGLDQETYELILWDVAKVRSSGDLDLAGRGKVLQRFKEKGWKPSRSKTSPKTRNKPKHEKTVTDKIRALWIDMHKSGVVRSGTEQSLNKYVKRLTGIDNVEWLSPRDAYTVIEALKKWQGRT